MRSPDGRLPLKYVFAIGGLAVGALIAIDAAVHVTAAQTPFGGPRPPSSEHTGGLIGWLLAKQSEFFREMSSTIRAAKSDGSAVWALLAISFGYGIFHAAGPGHGKAVISSYLVANQETARRGIVLSFLSAMLQSLVAVMLVAIGAWLLHVAAETMCGTERVIAIASYGLIAAFGARLVWTKGASFLRALQVRSSHSELVLASVGAPAGYPNQHHHHVHSHDDRAHDHDHGHDHHDQRHVHDEHCGHSHGPTPGELAGPGGWRRGLGTIFSVGLRPCSGAILVLVFALAQGLFWAGIAATFVMGLGTAITVGTIALLAVSAKGVARRLSGASEGSGALVMRGIEFAAAGLVLLFGIGLLTGYLFAEPLTCLKPIL